MNPITEQLGDAEEHAGNLKFLLEEARNALVEAKKRAERAEASELAHAKIACQARIDAERAEAELEECQNVLAKTRELATEAMADVRSALGAPLASEDHSDKRVVDYARELYADNARMRADLQRERETCAELVTDSNAITLAASLSKVSIDNARLRAALEKIVQGGYAEGSDRAHPAIALARDTLDSDWRKRAEAHYPKQARAALGEDEHAKTLATEEYLNEGPR